MTEAQSGLAAWLAELEAEVAERVIVIASIRQKLGLSAESPAPSPSVGAASNGQAPTREADMGPLRGDTFFGMNVPDAIRKYLAMTKRPQTPKQIVYALRQGGVLSQAQDFYANVSTSLKRLKGQGHLVKTAEGWGLSAWYTSGRSKQADTAKKPQAEKKRVTAAPKSAKAHRRPSSATGWHQFLGEATKRGKTMAEAGAEWKALKEAAAK